VTLSEKIDETIGVLQQLKRLQPEIDRATDLILETLRRGNKLLICGNGGSAAEAAHFATELTGRYGKDRRSLPAIALSSDGSLLSCIGNDYGFDQVFSRQIEGLSSQGDLVIVLTSSGNSPNILFALNRACELGLSSLSLLGRGGGKATGLADIELIIPGSSAAAAQECHLVLIHHFCVRIDEASH